MTDMGALPGGSISSARAINAAGETVGSSRWGLDAGLGITELGTLAGSVASEGRAIN